MTPETASTYAIASTTKHILYALALVSITIGIIGFWSTKWFVFLIPILVGAVLVFFGRRIDEDQVRFVNGSYVRYTGGRVNEEFDLRSIEEWRLMVRMDTEGGFSGATLEFKGTISNKELRVRYSDNVDLFKVLLVYLHREKRDLIRTNPASLEPNFPKSAVGIKAILKNW